LVEANVNRKSLALACSILQNRFVCYREVCNEFSGCQSTPLEFALVRHSKGTLRASKKVPARAEVFMILSGRAFAAIAVLAACGWASSATAGNRVRLFDAQESARAAQTAHLESVSGRITSVAGNTFTIETSQGSDGKRGAKQITFTIDQETVVEGRIAVGSTANVTFRYEDKNNIAVSVRVSAA
jgi:hypothetical protein